jgi:hypothetical protein
MMRTLLLLIIFQQALKPIAFWLLRLIWFDGWLWMIPQADSPNWSYHAKKNKTKENDI